MLGADLVAGEGPHDQPVAPHRLAFLADRLALARRQRRQKIVEGPVAVVVPVILLAEPQQPAAGTKAPPVGFGAESGMDRADVVVAGDLGQHVDHGVAHRLGERPGSGKQPRAGNRREGNGDLKLGVVAPAGALQGLRPAMVEHILTLRMPLHVERGRALQRAVGRLSEKVLRLPAGTPANRLGILQRFQEAVAEERVPGGARRQRARVPLRGVDGGQGLDDTQADGRGVVRHGYSIARIMPGQGRIETAFSLALRSSAQEKSPADLGRRTLYLVSPFRLGEPRRRIGLLLVFCKVASGGAREGHPHGSRKALVRGAKVNFGLRPYLFTASSS